LLAQDCPFGALQDAINIFWGDLAIKLTAIHTEIEIELGCGRLPEFYDGHFLSFENCEIARQTDQVFVNFGESAGSAPDCDGRPNDAGDLMLDLISMNSGAEISIGGKALDAIGVDKAIEQGINARGHCREI
jgi:hypothetical protein